MIFIMHSLIFFSKEAKNLWRSREDVKIVFSSHEIVEDDVANQKLTIVGAKWQHPRPLDVRVLLSKTVYNPRADEKNFWTPKMVHCPKFFWRRRGGEEVAEIYLFQKKIFGTSRAKSEKVGQISFCLPNIFLPVRPCLTYICLGN
jgi:hypothetical protein